jgi:hypothetical protein
MASLDLKAEEKANNKGGHIRDSHSPAKGSFVKKRGVKKSRAKD